MEGAVADDIFGGRRLCAVEAAHAYHARGWSVVLYPQTRKGPLTPGWQNLRLSDEDIRRRGGTCNVGVSGLPRPASPMSISTIPTRC